MARIIKEEEYAARRNEILNAAQRLIYTKGYEKMAIRDILDELQISKGAFYHYFDSKGALLEALVARLLDDAEKLLDPIVQDPGLSALDKLERYFATAARWKTDQKAYMLALMDVWYADENAIVRQKIFAMTVERIAPIIAAIIRQGIQEGVINTPYPDQAGELFLSLWQTLGDTFSRMLLAQEADYAYVESTVAAYTNAMERVLGTPSGSLRLIDISTLKEWFVSQAAPPTPAGQALAAGAREPVA
jgi:AcrR family transcriptional regulator